MSKNIIVRVLYFVLGLAVGLSLGCGDGSSEEELPTVGIACEVDADCASYEKCYQKLEGVNPWTGEDIEFVFGGGMCSMECEDLGDWYNGYDICLIWPPSREQLLFNSCRNDLGCRWEEGYNCTFVGPDGEQSLNACLPVQETDDSR